MLTHTLIHPRIIGSLAAAGHGSQVLIADANFPHATAVNPAAELVYLNLVPGELSAVTVLRALYANILLTIAALPPAPGPAGAPAAGPR